MGQRGVTLIELLVAMAVLMVVAAIVLPVVTRAKDHATNVTDISNLKQIGVAAAIYSGDYDDRNDGLAPLILGGYVKDPQILRSPRDHFKEGASRRLSRALHDGMREWPAEFPPVTYYSYKEATILRWFYDQEILDQPNSGWLINPVRFEFEQGHKILDGRYQRLLWDGSVQTRTIRPIDGVNSAGFEFSIQPTYSLFCDPDEEARKKWYSGG